MSYYVILSSGAYSDYCPVYYVGEIEVTQEQLTAKSLEVGNQMWREWEKLPTKKTKDTWAPFSLLDPQGYIDQKYDPQNPERYISNSGPSDDDFIKKMKDWLLSLGYQEIPNGIPEINVYYDVPRK